MDDITKNDCLIIRIINEESQIFYLTWYDENNYLCPGLFDQGNSRLILPDEIKTLVAALDLTPNGEIIENIGVRTISNKYWIYRIFRQPPAAPAQQ